MDECPYCGDEIELSGVDSYLGFCYSCNKQIFHSQGGSIGNEEHKELSLVQHPDLKQIMEEFPSIDVDIENYDQQVVMTPIKTIIEAFEKGMWAGLEKADTRIFKAHELGYRKAQQDIVLELGGCSDMGDVCDLIFKLKKKLRENEKI